MTALVKIHGDFQRIPSSLVKNLPLGYQIVRQDSLDHLRGIIRSLTEMVNSGKGITPEERALILNVTQRTRGMVIGALNRASNKAPPFFGDVAIRAQVDLLGDFEELDRALFFRFNPEKMDQFFYDQLWSLKKEFSKFIKAFELPVRGYNTVAVASQDQIFELVERIKSELKLNKKQISGKEWRPCISFIETIDLRSFNYEAPREMAEHLMSQKFLDQINEALDSLMAPVKIFLEPDSGYR